MADEREEEGVKIIDSRMLSDDERAGKSSGATDSKSASGPKLEILGGGTQSLQHSDADLESVDEDAALMESGFVGEEFAGEGEAELTEAQAEEMRVAMEEEQFQSIQERIGRPLTDEEKDQVREQMEAQAQAAISLEVAPVLLELMVKLPQYAAVHLGLIPNPYTQVIARNDGGARMAIEGFSALYDVVKTQLDAASRKEFERVLTDLKTNFSRITGQQIAPSGGSGPSPLITGPRIIR